MLVDTGYFMADERSAHGRLRPDIVTKNDWVMKAYGQFPADVVNVSSHDLRYFADAFAKTEMARRAETEPLFGRLVSANTVDERRGSPALRPFLIREVPSRQKGAKPVRVAFIGLTETTPAPPAGLTFTEPAEAATRAVREARKKADLVVVLAKIGSQQEVARIARETPGIDVIIDGNSVSLEDAFTPPVYVGQTLIVFTPFETMMLGELRFYRNAQGKFTTKQRFIALDETSIPEDPAAKPLVVGATRAEADARSNSRKLLENWLARSRAPVTAKSRDRDSARGESSPGYVTSAACSQCHRPQYMKWTGSAHARATDPLPPRAIEFEAGCLDCHATGSKPASAANKAEMALLQNVQCEQCHGPGSDHVAKPAKGYGRVANMQTACASCHTSETSPGFDLQAAWGKIKH
ncbi:MAG: multiheme c-type cytochrome [Acidobacteriota bacterium]